MARTACSSPSRDGETLTEAIAQLIENAPLRAAMGRRGREIAGIEFSLEQVIDANLAVYRSLLASIPIQRSGRAHCAGPAWLTGSVGRRSDHPQ